MPEICHIKLVFMISNEMYILMHEFGIYYSLPLKTETINTN